MNDSNIQEALGIEIYKNQIDYKIVDTFETDDFTRHLIEYLGSEDDKISAFLFIPKSKIIGAILVSHQHNGERHFGKSEVAGIVGDPFQWFCPELAKQGIVSIAPDSICFEDRRTNKQGIKPDENPENDWLQHYNEMCYRLLNGKLLMKKVVEDSSIALSILLQQEGLKKEAVGMLGHSYGGNTVLFHSPFDDRIKYACSSGAVCSYKAKFENNTGIEMAEVIPHFAEKYDIDDLLKLIYPREILIVSATKDKYSHDANEVYLSLIESTEAKVKDSYIFKEFEGEHSLDKARFDCIVGWFVEKFSPK